MNNSLLSTLIIAIAIVMIVYFISMSEGSRSTVSTSPVIPTLSTSAEGRVSVTPDIVVLSLGIQSRSDSSKEAYRKMTESMTSLKNLLKESGVEARDIQTTGIYLNPEYVYTDGNQKPNGFSATENLSVKVRKLDSANDILDKVSAIAGVQISSISYDLDKKDMIYSEARKLAIEKARAKADEMARVSGVKIIKVQSLSEGQTMNSPYPPMYQNTKVMADGIGGASTEISAGQLEYTIVVNVSYEIE